jgi:hypothetical protein
MYMKTPKELNHETSSPMEDVLVEKPAWLTRLSDGEAAIVILGSAALVIAVILAIVAILNEWQSYWTSL